MFQKFNLTSIFVVALLTDCILTMMHWSFYEVLEPPFALIMPLKFLICGCCIWSCFKEKLYTRGCYLSATLVLILMVTGAIRGIFSVEGYWGYKGWVSCVHSAMSFALLYPLGSLTITCKSLQSWNKYIFPIFILFGLWALKKDAYPFQTPFIYYFYILLFALVSSQPKARLIILFGTICTLLALENRSGFIKTVIAIGLCGTLYLPRSIVRFSHIFIHFFFYILPVVLLVLGLTGTFNVFESITEDEPTEITWHSDSKMEQLPNTNLTADTRTFLYADVIMSAIDGDYVLFGHSIGRGNTHSGVWTQDVEGMDSSERLMNEAQMLNIFTWTGILGVILFSLMYLQASCLGLFYSKNRYVPIIACSVAFHWAMSWLEELTSFNPMDYALFLLLGICFSPKFRNMSDLEFRLWFSSCFSAPKDITPFDVFKRLKLQLLLLKFRKKNEET